MWGAGVRQGDVSGLGWVRTHAVAGSTLRTASHRSRPRTTLWSVAMIARALGDGRSGVVE